MILITANRAHLSSAHALIPGWVMGPPRPLAQVKQGIPMEIALTLAPPK